MPTAHCSAPRKHGRLQNQVVCLACASHRHVACILRSVIDTAQRVIENELPAFCCAGHRNNAWVYHR